VYSWSQANARRNHRHRVCRPPHLAKELRRIHLGAGPSKTRTFRQPATLASAYASKCSAERVAVLAAINSCHTSITSTPKRLDVAPCDGLTAISRRALDSRSSDRDNNPPHWQEHPDSALFASHDDFTRCYPLQYHQLAITPIACCQSMAPHIRMSMTASSHNRHFRIRQTPLLGC
jgi:hypothetical protein